LLPPVRHSSVRKTPFPPTTTAASTATDPAAGVIYTSQYDIFTVGAGYLDMQNVMQSTDLTSSSVAVAKSPTVTRDSSGNIVLVTGSSVVWGNSVVLG
jgi:serine protease AprX